MAANHCDTLMQWLAAQRAGIAQTNRLRESLADPNLTQAQRDGIMQLIEVSEEMSRHVQSAIDWVEEQIGPVDPASGSGPDEPYNAWIRELRRARLALTFASTDYEEQEAEHHIAVAEEQLAAIRARTELQVAKRRGGMISASKPAPRKLNPGARSWLEHVKATQAHHGCSYSEAMKLAAKTYKK